MPDRGWAGPWSAAPTASNEAGHRPLVHIVPKDRLRTHPWPARQAHCSLLPIRPSPAGLADPLAAAAPADRGCHALPYARAQAAFDQPAAVTAAPATRNGTLCR